MNKEKRRKNKKNDLRKNGKMTINDNERKKTRIIKTEMKKEIAINMTKLSTIQQKNLENPYESKDYFGYVKNTN